MGKIYEQLSIEERTMIQTQLEMGIKPVHSGSLRASAAMLRRQQRHSICTAHTKLVLHAFYPVGLECY